LPCNTNYHDCDYAYNGDYCHYYGNHSSYDCYNTHHACNADM
jgi:hypothetical protein